MLYDNIKKYTNTGLRSVWLRLLRSGRISAVIAQEIVGVYLTKKAVDGFDVVDESLMCAAISRLKNGSVIGYIRDIPDIQQEDVNSIIEKYLV